MNDNIGPIYISNQEETGGYDKPFSKALDKMIDYEARNLIANAYYRTEKLLKDNREKLEKVYNLKFCTYYYNFFYLAC